MVGLETIEKTEDFLLFLFSTNFSFKERLAMSSVNKSEK